MANVVAMGHDAKRVNTPFGLPRSVFMGIYIAIIFFTGSTYWGWDGVQGLFYRSGAYAWTCDPDTPDTLTLGVETYVNCDERRSGINNMYTVAFTSFLIGSAIGGTAMDYFGEKVTALIGHGIAASGWLLWSLSSESFPAYYAGAILIGLASDPGYLPFLTLRQLYPENQSLVLGIAGSTRSLSFAVPIIMNQISVGLNMSPESTFTVVKLYVGIVMSCVMIATILFLPRHGFSEPEDTGMATDSATVELDTNCQFGRDKVGDELLAPTKGAAGRSVGSLGTQAPHSIDGMDGITNSQIVANVNINEPDGLIRIIKGRRLWTAIVIVMVMMIRAEFFTKSHRDQLTVGDENAWTLFSLMNILSFAPGPLMGWIADKWTINMTQTIINTAAVLQYGLASIPSLPAKYGACLMVLIVNSFVLSSLYCFVKDYFPKKHFGKIIGICDLAGGLFSLLSIPIYQLGVTSDSFVVPNMLMIGAGIIAGIAIILQWQETENRNKKSLPTPPPEAYAV